MARKWRFSSFKLDCALVLAVLLAFVCWALIDASFGAFVNPQSYRVFGPGWEGHIRPDYYLRYDWFFIRLAIFCALTCVWLLGIGDIVYRLVRGTTSDRSLRSLFVVVTLLGMTCGLVIGARQLHGAALRYRVAFTLDGFKEDVAALEEKWPTAPGELSSAGTFRFNEWSPNVLFIDSPAWLVKERTGDFILRLDDGGCAFDLQQQSGLFVEHHPPASQPKSFTLVMGRPPSLKQPDFVQEWTLVNSVEIESGWFLTTYESKVVK